MKLKAREKACKKINDFGDITVTQKQYSILKGLLGSCTIPETILIANKDLEAGEESKWNELMEVLKIDRFDEPYMSFIRNNDESKIQYEARSEAWKEFFQSGVALAQKQYYTLEKILGRGKLPKTIDIQLDEDYEYDESIWFELVDGLGIDRGSEAYVVLMGNNDSNDSLDMSYLDLADLA